jgi:hypothetical protein
VEDAICNNMGPPGGEPDMRGMKDVLTVENVGTPAARWTFPLSDRFKPVDFRAGSATAMAIGVFVDKQKHQRGFFWSEPVRLTEPGAMAS